MTPMYQPRTSLMSNLVVFVMAAFMLTCTTKEEKDDRTLGKILESSPSIMGRTEYLPSPFVTAGDRLYMVGHQDGSFPEIGWHLPGEMGGIWDHPIKLMDGFQIVLEWPELSWPLDSASTFVNYPVANKHLFELDSKQVSVERWQFVPDAMEGLVVQLTLKNDSDADQVFTLKFTGNVDLRPTWLGERTEMKDHQDQLTYNSQLDIWEGKDEQNPWYVVFGADQPSVGHEIVPSAYAGQGAAGQLSYDIRLAPDTQQTLSFFIAGSYVSNQNARNVLHDLKSNSDTLLKSKRDRYAELAERSKLTIPDKELQETFEWLKYNCDWLVRTVPGVGTGIMAGIPDYPWWFGVDSEYALKGYMAIGQYDIVFKTIELLDSLSTASNGNGRIVHEASTNGAVFNPGNINETPQFASLIWEVYRWSGSKEFLERYYPVVKAGLKWTLEQNDQDGNLFPEGFGMMEIHGLNSEMVDVASYTQKAFEDASHMAGVLGETEVQSRYQKISERLKQQINDRFWAEDFKSYADFIGTDQQAIKLIDEAIVRADTLNKPWAIEELQATKKFILANPSQMPRPFVTHHNWVVNTPMEMQIADHEKALIALNTARGFVNPFGMFVTGIDRDESAGTDDGSFAGAKVFSYTGAVMTLPTGVQAVAENNYGRPDQALEYLKKMTSSFSYALPGSMYEVSPDYGMMTQAWNIYSFAVPIINQFFGISPDAGNQAVTIQFQMPSEWDKASLENVRVGDNELDIHYEKTAERTAIKISQELPHWILDVVIPEVSSEQIQVFKGSKAQIGRETRLSADSSGLLEFEY